MITALDQVRNERQGGLSRNGGKEALRKRRTGTESRDWEWHGPWVPYSSRLNQEHGCLPWQLYLDMSLL